uniref:follistatin-related protein 5-like isoform X1 n=1 Tax=Styela clava TaxID=7725 RepID=UPI00193AA045|nr:follistatin-related protein 5-like isoform X1 [Styela clava]
MQNAVFVVLWVVSLSMVIARPEKNTQSFDTNAPDPNEIISQLPESLDTVHSDGKIQKDDITSRRKNIVHKKRYNDANLSIELFRETLSHHVGNAESKTDRCRYMRCQPGEECLVEDERAKCVCKRHCKARHHPICGTDGEYYENHCEMHRQACLSVRDIYDARHKDCFYKASECSGWELKQYQEMMMQFYRNVMTSAKLRHNEGKDGKVQTKLNRSKRSTKKERTAERKTHRRGGLDIIPGEAGDPETNKIVPPITEELDVSPSPKSRLQNDVSTSPSDTPPDQIPSAKQVVIKDSYEFLNVIQSKINLSNEYEEIMTKDSAGDMVKYIFALMDLDSNGNVGSDEIWEITSLQHLDNVLPGPCSLFHILKYGDTNLDRTLDISETFELFNISVYRLQNQKRYVHRPATYGNPMQLECGIEGESSPVWYRYGRKVQEKNGAKVLGRTLYISDVTSKNAGNYTCSTKKKESITQTINLQIMVAPKVEIHPRTQHPSLQSSATVKCHAEGLPRPRITWKRNGESLDLKSGRYILMANNTELHFNSVEEQDSAAYSCTAENAAGVGEDVGAIYVQTDDVHESESEASSAYFVFHEHGISIMDPHSCQLVRSIQNTERVPGLLSQDKLCDLVDDETRQCMWSDSIEVGYRFIYVAQPTEDRIIVVDKQLQRVVEVITTDLMPVELYYVKSTDQVFVVCWADSLRTGSLIQVIHRAAVTGTHFAEHVKPVAISGHRTYDRAIHSLYIPPETPLNPNSEYGYILHKNEAAIHRLNLATLTYSNPIDLSPYGCIPLRLNYLPIGGLLYITCESEEDGKTIHEIAIDIETDVEVIFKKNTGVAQEFFSYDYSFAIKLRPGHDMITLHNISNGGEMHEFMMIRTNFQVADTYFARKKYNPESMVAYMVAKNQGDIMYVDLEKKKVEIINGMTTPAPEHAWPWRERSRKMTPSGWFGWFLATAGRTGMEILGMNSNQVLCRMDQFVRVTAVSWSGGEF